MIRLFVYTTNAIAGELLIKYYESYDVSKQLLCNDVMLYSFIMEEKNMEDVANQLITCFAWINEGITGHLLPTDDSVIKSVIPLVTAHYKYKTPMSDYNGVNFQFLQ